MERRGLPRRHGAVACSSERPPATARGLGYGMRFARLFDFGFGTTDTERIWMFTFAVQHPLAGRLREGRLPAGRRGSPHRPRSNGQWIDAVMMSILRDEWAAQDRPRSWDRIAMSSTVARPGRDDLAGWVAVGDRRGSAAALAPVGHARCVRFERTEVGGELAYLLVGERATEVEAPRRHLRPGDATGDERRRSGRRWWPSGTPSRSARARCRRSRPCRGSDAQLVANSCVPIGGIARLLRCGVGAQRRLAHAVGDEAGEEHEP